MGHEDHWLQVRQACGSPTISPAKAGPTVDTTIAALELAAGGAGCALAHRIFLGRVPGDGPPGQPLEADFEDGARISW